MLRTLRHPHIVNVLNFWTSDNQAVLAMELHSQSNLQQVVRRSSSLDELTAKSLFQSLVLIESDLCVMSMVKWLPCLHNAPRMLLEAVDFLHQKRACSALHSALAAFGCRQVLCSTKRLARASFKTMGPAGFCTRPRRLFPLWHLSV